MTYKQIEMFKFCTNCKIYKDLNDFIKSKKASDGLGSQCKVCKSNKDSSDKLPKRKFIWEYKKANPCIHCGESDPIVLIFDHLKDKKFNISKMMGHKLENIKKEIEKCRIICSNCHARVTSVQQNWYKDFIKDEEINEDL